MKFVVGNKLKKYKKIQKKKIESRRCVVFFVLKAREREMRGIETSD
jgi:hypothetical protein